MSDKTGHGGGVARREVFGLAAGAAAVVAASGATLAAETAPPPPRRGRLEMGDGVPVVTKVISTSSGRVQGLVNDGVHTFKGVRYGAPPVGALRWMPPQKPVPSTVILDCSDYGAPAMQMATGATAAPATDFGMQMSRVFTTPSELKIQNEDCLFLNVWTPGTDARARPVMFWIHGGGFAYGSGGQPIYCGEDLARDHDVVVVGINHRLNIFGYLYLGEAFGDAYKSSGTVGMQDIVLALEWVKDNIAGFGGDPGNVTIMGQSGGGAKVSLLMAMDSAKGLFHKASIQSGPGLVTGRKEAAAKAAHGLLDELGIKAGDLAALQAVPAARLIEAAFAAQAKASTGPRLPGMPGGGGGFGFGPILDGVAITRDPFVPDGPAVSAEVPLLLGYTKDEMTLFTAGSPWFGTMTEDQLRQFTAPIPKGPAIVEAWRKIRPDYSPTYLFTATISSMFAFGGSVKLGEAKAAQHAAPVYMWYMTWDTPVAGGIFKSPHTMEIPFMMDSYRRVRAFVGPDPGAANMARQIAGAWVAFARSGKPDCKEIPHWPAYDATTRATMVFDTRSKVVMDPNAEVRKILQS
ncbi:MAG TPA: carboxylesterase family protein [Rhizomicrobium sp.]|jgi:para-nitrobenzyl esterase|nr:carboxylesterase family protein [Rhizomicrobium sp.]